MNRWTRPALGTAVVASMIAIADAVFQGVGVLPPWSPDGGTWWAQTAVDLVHTAAYLLFVAVLVSGAARIDADRQVVRWLRRLLVVDLTVLSAIFLFGSPLGLMDNEVLGIVGTIGFLLMFVLGAGLGVALVRRTGLRLPATLMIAPLVLVPLVFVVDAVAPGWGHPAYAEAALYVGLALVARAAPAPSQAVSPGLTGRNP